MNGPKKFLAFDIGASGGRAVVGIFDEGRLILDEIHRFPNEYVEVHGSIHWDILGLFLEIKRGLALSAKKYGADLDGIGVDAWALDFALFDKKGDLIGNPHHYRDRRTKGITEEISSLIDRYEIYTISGCQLTPMSTISQLYSMIKDDSSQLRIADYFLMMPGMINYFLTGERVEEYTIMTPTCLYDIREDGPATSFLKKLNIPIRIMPKVIRPGTIIGQLLPEIREEVGLGKVPVVAPAAHDTASAAIAVPATSTENWAFLSSGTWFVLGIETPKPITTRKSYELDIDNTGTAGGKFIARANATGLWIIQKCREFWRRQGKTLDYEQVTELAESARPSRVFIDFDDEVFLNPVDMPRAIIEYCTRTGQRIPEDKGTMIRMVLESLALKCKEMLKKIESVTEKSTEILYLIGGGTQNKLLNQLVATATERTIITGPTEAAAIGNIAMQSIGTGHLRSIDEARHVIRSSFQAQVYYPKKK